MFIAYHFFMNLIYVFAETPERLETIIHSLRKAAFSVSGSLFSDSEMSIAVSEPRPLAIVVDIALPSPAFIEHLATLSSKQSIPVVVFTPDESREHIELAIQRGIAAYVVNGFEAARVETIIHVAVARFRALQNLSQELYKKEKALAERKIIERAKGILMEERGLSENDAFVTLRKTAMSSGKSVIDIATQIIILAKFPLTTTNS